MSVLSISAFEQLAEYISQETSLTLEQICPIPSEPNHQLGSPSLGLNPITFRYFPNQEKEFTEESFDTAVLEVGRHEVDMVWYLNARNARTRAKLQWELVEMFLKQELSPGVITLTVPDCWDAYCSWELQSEEWESERVFDKKWYSTINVTAQLPALILRGGVYTIEDLQLGLLHDLTRTVDIDTFDTDSLIERVSIDEDGNLTTT